MTTTSGSAGTGGFPSLAFFRTVRDAVNADGSVQRATQWFDASVLLSIGDQRI